MQNPLNTQIEIHIKSMSHKDYQELLGFVYGEKGKCEDAPVFRVSHGTISDTGGGPVYREVVIAYSRQKKISEKKPPERIKALSGPFEGLANLLTTIEARVKAEESRERAE